MLSYLMFLIKQMVLLPVYIFYIIKIKCKDSIESLGDLYLTLNRTSFFIGFFNDTAQLNWFINLTLEELSTKVASKKRMRER